MWLTPISDLACLVQLCDTHVMSMSRCQKHQKSFGRRKKHFLDGQNARKGKNLHLCDWGEKLCEAHCLKNGPEILIFNRNVLLLLYVTIGTDRK